MELKWKQRLPNILTCRPIVLRLYAIILFVRDITNPKWSTSILLLSCLCSLDLPPPREWTPNILPVPQSSVVSARLVTVIPPDRLAVMVPSVKPPTFDIALQGIYKGHKISKHWNFCEHHYRGLYCYRKEHFFPKACQDYPFSQWSRKIYLLLIHYIALSQ